MYLGVFNLFLHYRYSKTIKEQSNGKHELESHRTENGIGIDNDPGMLGFVEGFSGAKGGLAGNVVLAPRQDDLARGQASPMGS
jgi:hypothetical protein